MEAQLVRITNYQLGPWKENVKKILYFISVQTCFSDVALIILILDYNICLALSIEKKFLWNPLGFPGYEEVSFCWVE